MNGSNVDSLVTNKFQKIRNDMKERVKAVRVNFFRILLRLGSNVHGIT